MERASKKYQPELDENLALKRYFFLFIVNWYLFVISFVVFLLGVNFYIKLQNPVYAVSSTILISDKASSLTGVESIIEELGIFSRTSRKEVLNEIERLKSYKLINQTIDSLDFDVSYVAFKKRGLAERELYKSSPFIVNIDTSVLQKYNYQLYVTILSKRRYLLEADGEIKFKKKLSFGEQFENNAFSFNIVLRDPENYVFNPAAYNKFYFYINNKHDLITTYRRKLGIEMSNVKASVLIVSTTGNVIEKEIDFLNMLGKVFLESELTTKNNIAENTLKFIEDQLEIIRDSLELAQRDLLNFRKGNNISDIEKTGDNLFNKINDLQNEKMQLLIKQNYYDYLYKKINGDKAESIVLPEGLGLNNQLDDLVKKFNELILQKKVLYFSAKEANPAVGKLNLQLKETKEMVMRALLNNSDATKVGIEDIETRIVDASVKIGVLPLQQIQLMNLDRKVKLNDNLLTFLLEKRANLQLLKTTNVPGNQILDIARTQNATIISPNQKNIRTFSLILSLLLPALFVFMKDFFNEKILSREDIERLSTLSVIGKIGHNRTKSDKVVGENIKSSITESFRTLRTNIQFMLSENENMIAINSVVSGEGKTFTAVNLASIFAVAGKKTLLIGLDLRKPKIHRIFDCSNKMGLSTILSGIHNFEECLINTEIENLIFLPAGPVPPNPAELIMSDQMKKLMEKVKNEFDYVIIDSPPVGLVSDAIYFSKYSNVNIFVLRQDYSRKEFIETINLLADEEKFKKLCLVINDISRPHYYTYDYSYWYSYRYKYGYNYKYYSSYYNDEEEPKKIFDKIKKVFNISWADDIPVNVP